MLYRSKQNTVRDKYISTETTNIHISTQSKNRGEGKKQTQHTTTQFAERGGGRQRNRDSQRGSNMERTETKAKIMDRNTKLNEDEYEH